MAKEVSSNMAGTVLRVLVNVGETISLDQDILSIESMKMEMMLASTGAGKVKEIKVAVDDFIQEGQVVLVLE
jgi:acetyl-CoA carboxylase biotin carboxyl carrier protein